MFFEELLLAHLVFPFGVFTISHQPHGFLGVLPGPGDLLFVRRHVRKSLQPRANKPRSRHDVSEDDECHHDGSSSFPFETVPFIGRSEPFDWNDWNHLIGQLETFDRESRERNHLIGTIGTIGTG